MSRWKAEIQFEARDCNSFLEVIVFVNSFNQILRIYWNIHQWCIKFSLNPGYAHVDLCSHTINNFFLRQTNFRLLSPEKINFIIFFPYVNLWYIIFHLLSFFFFFFADWQVNISDFSRSIQRYKTDVPLFESELQTAKSRSRSGKLLFQGLFRVKIFPAKKLRQIWTVKDACVKYYLFCK